MSEQASFGEFTRWLGDAYEAHQRGKGAEGTVKKAALVQTPNFVGDFLLDRTLDPAIAEFGLEGFRMIDPTCGTGHLLCQTFDRLWARWEAHAPRMDRAARAQAVLDSIHGIDIDRMAVALARFRLGLAASNAAGLSVQAIACWRIYVGWGNSLMDADTPLQPYKRPDAPAWCLGGLAREAYGATVDECWRRLEAEGVRVGDRYRHFRGKAFVVAGLCLREADLRPAVLLREADSPVVWVHRLEELREQVLPAGKGGPMVERFTKED